MLSSSNIFLDLLLTFLVCSLNELVPLLLKLGVWVSVHPSRVWCDVTGNAQLPSEEGGTDKKEPNWTPAGITPSSSSPTPPPQRRLAKSFSVAPSAMTKGTALMRGACWLFALCALLTLLKNNQIHT